MKKRYFLTDLDGTLLRNDTSISDYTIKVLSDAISQGAVISYSTARSYTSSTSVTSQIPWLYPVVLYNGALIFDPIKKVVISGCWLSKDITNAIIEEGKKHDLSPLLFCIDEINTEHVFHERLEKNGYIQFLKSRKDDARFKEVKELKCSDEYRPLIVTYIGTISELEPIKTKLEKLFKGKIHVHFMMDNYIKNHYFLELTNPNANKEQGVILWSKLVGCEPSEVIAFGDNLNDIGMFVQSGKKIAVSNAHLQLKEIADEVIMNNEEDGVANYIYHSMEFAQESVENPE